jgi:hypothetical protein
MSRLRRGRSCWSLKTSWLPLGLQRHERLQKAEKWILRAKLFVKVITLDGKWFSFTKDNLLANFEMGARKRRLKRTFKAFRRRAPLEGLLALLGLQVRRLNFPRIRPCCQIPDQILESKHRSHPTLARRSNWYANHWRYHERLETDRLYFKQS